MSNADTIVERLRLLISRRTGQSLRNNKSDDSALRMALWDLHNHVPQNLELFEIWQALNSAKRDPERFEAGVSRLVVFLRSYPSPQNARPSQFDIVHGGEDAHSFRRNDPRTNAIGVHSLGLSDTTRPQPPDPQPLFHSLSQADYVEVQDVGKIPQPLPLNSQYFNHTTGKISFPEEHTSMPSSVPIEIVPQESGGHQPYDGSNRDGYAPQQLTNATSGSAMHSEYSAVPELMEPAIPLVPTTQSETPMATSDSVPPSGPRHAMLLEPMATGIHPSYYESTVHQRVSGTGIMTVTPVLRARTPVQYPDSGVVYGAPATRSPSQRNYRSPSQYIPSGPRSPVVGDADTPPTSDQKAGSRNPSHAQLGGSLPPISPNKWVESRDLHNVASPVSGSHTEWPEISSPPSDESSPSAAGYEGSPHQAVSPSTTEHRSPTRRASAGTRLSYSPSLTRRADPPSAVTPRLEGSVPGSLRQNSAIDPFAFHGTYAASRYSSPSSPGDAGIPLRPPASRVMPKSPLAVQQETASRNSNSVTSSNDNLQAHTHSTPGSSSPYVPVPYDQNIPIQHPDPSEVIWPPEQGQQLVSSNMSGTLASPSKTYHPPSNGEGRYNSSTNYTSTGTHDQKHLTSHESQGLWSSPQEPQPALWNIPPPPGTQSRLPTHLSAINTSQYESSSSYTSSLSHNQTVPAGQSDYPFQVSQIPSNPRQASGTLHADHLAQPPTGNNHQYNSSSGSIPQNHSQNNVSPQHQVQSHLSQGSQSDRSGISQHPRVQPEFWVPQPSTSEGQYNPASSSNVSSAAYGQTRNPVPSQAPSSSSRPSGFSGFRQNSINRPVPSGSLTSYAPSMPNTMSPTFPTQSYQQSDSSAPAPSPQLIASAYSGQYVETQGNALARYAEIPTPPQHYKGAMRPGQQSSISQQVDSPSSLSSFGISPQALYQRGGGPPNHETQNKQAQLDQMDQMNAMMSVTSIGGHHLRGADVGIFEG